MWRTSFALALALCFCARAAAQPLNAGEQAFLDDLQKRAFTYFIEQADPVTGLVRDRAGADGSHKPPHADAANIAASGFALTALCIGASRGWIAPDQARRRAETALEFAVEKSTQVRGWFYHFVNPADGSRMWTSEVSSIDTGFLIAGALTAKSCFPEDAKISRLADALYRRADFKWMLDGGTLLSHGWTPEAGFIKNRWDTCSEHLLLTLLAVAAPQNPAPQSAWTGWRRDVVRYSSYTFVSADAPLFVHQYPQAWADLRWVCDSTGPVKDFFANSADATRAHRQYCVDASSRYPAYMPQVWGFTASDSARGYTAWGGLVSSPEMDGTLAPAAAAGSLMFAPDIALPALMTMKEKYPAAWGRYGFADAFNPGTGWQSPDVIAIDLGITLLSAENLRTGDVWRWFMCGADGERLLEKSGLKRRPSKSI
ncbi:MAG: hypothetical protein GX410_00675 [Elusimicrobia bacterium]|nr:hypothetical protein [Elusimicrobiota bacterium]